MAADAVRELANPVNRRILAAVAVEPGHARRIAGLLELPESEVSRRFAAMERAGLLLSSWERRKNNVKLYRLAAASWNVQVTDRGVEITPAEGAATRPRTSPASSAIPATGPFFGRAAELGLLEKGPGVILVEGLPGIGKTTLLARFAAEVGAFWFTCRGTETLGWLATQYAVYLASMGLDEDAAALRAAAGTPAASSILLELWQGDGSVTVLDDVHRVADGGLQALVHDAIASMRAGRLLLASRERIVHSPRPGVQALTLAGLDEQAAVAMLGHAGIPVPAELRPHLIAEVGGHPLALGLLAEAAHSQPLTALLDGRPERDLTAYLLEEIDAGLKDNERAVLSHASLYPHPFQPGDLASLGDRQAEALLGRLQRRHLVTATAAGFRLPEVVRNFFYERLQDKQRLHRAAARQRLARGDVDGHLEALQHLHAAGDRKELVALLARDLAPDVHERVGPEGRRVYSAILEGLTRDEAGDAGWAQILDERGDLAAANREWKAAVAFYDEAARLFAQRDPARFADVMAKHARCLRSQGAAPGRTPGQVAMSLKDSVARPAEGTARLAEHPS